MPKKPTFTDDVVSNGLPGGAPTRPMNETTPSDPPPATRPVDEPEQAATDPPEPTHQVAEPDPGAPEPSRPDTSGRDSAGHQRPATRIHGYGGGAQPADEEGEEAESADAEDKAAGIIPVVGWLVVVDGPGRGAAVPLVSGMNSIGRGDENIAPVDFGDDTISREAHAYVTYDNEGRNFHVSHAGKTNLVRLNDSPVLETQDLTSGDHIRIGATKMRFVALCGPDFDWSDD